MILGQKSNVLREIPQKNKKPDPSLMGPAEEKKEDAKNYTIN